MIIVVVVVVAGHGYICFVQSIKSFPSGKSIITLSRARYVFHYSDEGDFPCSEGHTLTFYKSQTEKIHILVNSNSENIVQGIDGNG